MKTNFTTVLIFIFFSFTVNAQLKVLSNQNVGVGTVTPQKTFEAVSGVNDFVSIGKTVAAGQYTGLHFGYLEATNNYYRKSALVFERLDNAARGKIHILNNAGNDNTSATLSDARLTINYDGNIGIGTRNPISALSVGGDGSALAKSYIQNNNTATGQRALYTYQKMISSGMGYNICAVYEQGSTSGMLVGIYGSAYRGPTAYSSGRTYGVYGIAGNATSGHNYGVVGELLGTNGGAAIYAATSSKPLTSVSGIWAGYFRGNVKVEDVLWVNSTQYTSDIRAKKEIRNLESNNVEKIRQLKAIKYKLKSPSELNIGLKTGQDTMKAVIRNSDLDDPKYKEDRIGLSAQEIQAVYPELVKTDNDGILGVDYIGLIPVLVEAIKEQQAKIDELEQKVALLSGKTKKN